MTSLSAGTGICNQVLSVLIAVLPGLPETKTTQLTLLGSPLGKQATVEAIETKKQNLETEAERLGVDRRTSSILPFKKYTNNANIIVHAEIVTLLQVQGVYQSFG